MRQVRDDVCGPKGACRREHGVGRVSAFIDRQDNWEEYEYVPPYAAFARTAPNATINVRNDHLVEKFTLPIGPQRVGLKSL